MKEIYTHIKTSLLCIAVLITIGTNAAIGQDFFRIHITTGGLAHSPTSTLPAAFHNGFSTSSLHVGLGVDRVFLINKKTTLYAGFGAYIFDFSDPFFIESNSFRQHTYLSISYGGEYAILSDDLAVGFGVTHYILATSDKVDIDQRNSFLDINPSISYHISDRVSVKAGGLFSLYPVRAIRFSRGDTEQEEPLERYLSSTHYAGFSLGLTFRL